MSDALFPTSIVSLFVMLHLVPSAETEFEILDEICVVLMTEYEWTRPEAAALCKPVVDCATLLVWLVAHMALYVVAKPLLTPYVKRFVRWLCEAEDVVAAERDRERMETVFRQLDMLARERYRPVILPDGTFALAVVIPVVPPIPPPPKQGWAARVVLLVVIVAVGVVWVWAHGLLEAAEPAPEPETAAPVLSDPTPSSATMDLYRVLALVAQLNTGVVLVLWNMVA